MAEIIPAVLAETFEDIEKTLESFVGLTKVVHLDVCDGRFVPSKTWPYREGDEEQFEKIVSEAEGLPFWQEFDYEIHLMVLSPEIVVPKWISAGASRIIVHEEAVQDFSLIENGAGQGIEMGVAIDLQTSPESLDRLHGKFDFIQCMAIREVGHQGQQFEPAVFEKLRTLTKIRPLKTLSVDGGVNRENAKALIEAGAHRLVIGSAITRSGDIAESISYFKSL